MYEKQNQNSYIQRVLFFIKGFVLYIGIKMIWLERGSIFRFKTFDFVDLKDKGTLHEAINEIVVASEILKP